MHIDYINENQVIERYVLGKLSEKELVEFELYFFENPDILDEVEMVRSLRTELDNQQDLLKPVRAPMENPLSQKLKEFVRTPLFLAGNFATVATLLALVLLPDQEVDHLAFKADPLWVGQVRGAEQPLELELSSPGIAFDIDIDEPGKYSISLRDSSGRKVRGIGPVQARSNSLMVVITATDLIEGSYTLEVMNSQGDILSSRELMLSRR